MTKLYIKVPALGGKKAHWSLISTNALGPTPTSEGLLHLKQYDGSWHRHVPRNYPNESALRIRLKSGDWPESLRLAPAILGDPAMVYSMIGYSRPDDVPAGTSAWITNSWSVQFYDASQSILPLPYEHNPFETQPFFPFDRVLHIPGNTDPYYNGYDPAVFYPAVFWSDTDPTTLFNANGLVREGSFIGGTQPVAGVYSYVRDWEINPMQSSLKPTYYLFPKRYVQNRQVCHVVVDLRWIREHTPVQNIQAAEIVFEGYFIASVSSGQNGVPTGFQPADYKVYLFDTTGSVRVRETTIGGAYDNNGVPANLNFYSALDPDAQVFEISFASLTAARDLFDSGGTALDTFSMLGSQGTGDSTTDETESAGGFEYRLQLSPQELANTDYMTFMLATDEPPPLVTEFGSTSLGTRFNDVTVHLYN